MAPLIELLTLRNNSSVVTEWNWFGKRLIPAASEISSKVSIYFSGRTIKPIDRLWAEKSLSSEYSCVDVRVAMSFWVV